MSFFTIYDGRNKAGLGSIIQAQLILNAYAKKNKMLTLFPGFKRLDHWQNEAISQEKFSNQLNYFISDPDLKFKFDQRKYISHLFLVKYWSEFNIDYILRTNHNIYKKKFKKNKVKTISIHYRNFLSTDRGVNQNDPRFSLSKKYFVNAIKLSRKKLKKNFKVNVYCIKEDHITDYLKKKFDANIRTGVSLKETFYELIVSNVLITSLSSLSWSAHLYGLNDMVISRAFWHPWSGSTILLNNEGKLSSKKITIQLIKRKLSAILYYSFKKNDMSYLF